MGENGSKPVVAIKISVLIVALLFFGLGALAIYSNIKYPPSAAKAYNDAARSSLLNARTAVEAYWVDHNKCPDPFVVESKTEGSTVYWLVPSEGLPETRAEVSH